jgi:hypothetical protein
MTLNSFFILEKRGKWRNTLYPFYCTANKQIFISDRVSLCAILLPQPPEFWDYRNVPPHQAEQSFFEGYLNQTTTGGWRQAFPYVERKKNSVNLTFYGNQIEPQRSALLRLVSYS